MKRIVFIYIIGTQNRACLFGNFVGANNHSPDNYSPLHCVVQWFKSMVANAETFFQYCFTRIYYYVQSHTRNLENCINRRGDPCGRPDNENVVVHENIYVQKNRDIHKNMDVHN